MNIDQLHLRSLVTTDIDFLFAIENNRSLWHLSNTVIPYSRAVLEKYIANAHQDIFSVKQQRFVLTNTAQTPLGLVDLYDFDAIHKRAGVGIVVQAKNRGKGWAKKALNLVEEIAFNQLKLHQLYAGVGEDNVASLALFEALGYERTAVKKEWNFYHNRYHDEVVFQKIKHV
ncbi:GNAT family N-acetyltransferase [Flavobacteriaceae bacterium]|nr:GNAT family N-acetyltransferase [Flavobacteriaceae bacterium]